MAAVTQPFVTPVFEPPIATVPEVEICDSKYVVRFARNAAEVDAALKLRFEVFNLECEEGLASSFLTGRDRDEFDATCQHLIAIDRSNENVVGTYRLRTMEMAHHAGGFYSAAEFALDHIPFHVLNNAVELGRACIAQSHRNRKVLFLLWRALARYVTVAQKRFLFGCCSLTSQDADEGHALHRHLAAGGHLHPSFEIPVQAGYACAASDGDRAQSPVKVPKLFDAYLSIGAKVCSPPALDRRFKTIDFLVLFDVCAMNPRRRALFFNY